MMKTNMFKWALSASMLMAGISLAEEAQVATPVEAVESVSEAQPVPEAADDESSRMSLDLPQLTEEEAAEAVPSQQPTFMTSQGGQAVPGAVAPQEDIRDIRGPISVPEVVRWDLVAIGLLALIGLFAVGWAWWRRRSTVRARKAYETAFAQLEKAKSLMKPEQARAFSYLVSETIRTYIDKQFHLGVKHRTTQEVVRELLDDSEGPLQVHSHLLKEFMSYCDLAKYAQWGLSQEEMQAMLISARRFVAETRPKEEKELKQEAKAKQSEPENELVIEPAYAVGGAS